MIDTPVIKIALFAMIFYARVVILICRCKGAEQNIKKNENNDGAARMLEDEGLELTRMAAIATTHNNRPSTSKECNHNFWCIFQDLSQHHQPNQKQNN